MRAQEKRGSKNYIEWRNHVLKRDNYTCQECGATEKLEVHHKKPVNGFPELIVDVDNGQTLCHKCHQKAEGHKLIKFNRHRGSRNRVSPPEVRKSVKITVVMDEALKDAIKFLGVTEASFIKMAIYDKLRGLK